MTTPPGILKLESASIRESAELQRMLVASLEARDAVRIDAASMERVDTPSLQLLAAFVRDVRAAKRSIEWIARSDALDRAAVALGLTTALGLA